MPNNQIRIVWIPNQLTKDGRIEKFFEPVPGRTLKEYLDTDPFELPAKDIGFLSSAAGKVDPAVYVPQAAEEILIIAELKDPISIALGIGWALTASLTASMAISTMIAVAYTVGGIVLAGALALVGFAIYSAFQKPKKPSFGTQGGAGAGSIEDSSPTYAWDGIRTIQDVGVPVGVIYGTHRVGGNIINQYVWNDGAKEYLNLLIGLGEGEISSISDILVNENPFANFADLTKFERMGTNDQAVISGFEELHNVATIGATLAKDTPYTQTTTDFDVEAFEVEVSFPYGLYDLNSSGEYTDITASFRVEYKLHTDGDGDWVDLGLTSITNKSRTNVRKKVKVTGLTPGQYDIRLTKTTEESSSLKMTDMKFNRLDEIKNDDLAYPNTALLGLKLLATDQLSGGTPTVSSLVKGVKVKTYKVMNGETEVAYDDYYWDPADGVFKLFADDTPLTWDGETYVTSYSANPAWCFYDLLTNKRYGLGEFISTTNIDLASTIEMAKYCDHRLAKGDGTFEKRFEFAVVLDSAHAAIDVLIQLCATFRAWAFYSQGTVRLKIDKPESPVQLFGMGNIIEGSFQQSWKSMKDIPNVIEVQFLDANKNYEQEVVAVTDESSLATNPSRMKSLRVFTTSISRALREGRYALNIGRYVHRSISFKASCDAVACQAGDIISVSHELPEWGVSGRVVSATSTTIVFDKPVTFETGINYKVRCRMADDTIEERNIINPMGAYSSASVSVAWTKTPELNDVWVLGVTNNVKKDFRIITIKREGNSEVAIECAEYSELVYDDSAPLDPTNNYVDPDADIPDVENLLLTERVVKLPDGTIQNVVDIWWEKPESTGYVFRDFRYAKLYLSTNGGGSWELIAQTAGNHWTIETGIIEGVTYTVAAVSLTNSGTEKELATAPRASVTVTGKNDPPSAVSSFLAYQRQDQIVFGWPPVTDTDLDSYEIRRGAAWASGTVLGSGIKGQYFATNLVVTGADQSFWIKAVDTSGNYSETATEAVVTVESLPFSNIVMEWTEEEDLGLAWDDFTDETFDSVDDLAFSDTAWTGQKTGMVLDGTALAFDTGILEGTYVTRLKDVGYVGPFRVAIVPMFALSGDEAWDSLGEDTFETDPEKRFSGAEVAVGMAVRIRTSEDNITWSEWVEWQDADFYCRFFQLEYTLTRFSADVAAEVASLREIADLPDVDEGGDGEVLIAATGAEVVFAKTYHVAPSVAISILSGDGQVAGFSVNPTITGCTVKLYKLDGTAVTGTFSYLVHGI